MNLKQNNIPTWFWIVAAIFLLWNLMGLASFFQHITMSAESLQAMPTNERELYGKYPLWTKLVFALAVFSGLFGSIALLLKKKIAKPLFILSLIAIIIQMGHSLFIAKATDVYGSAAFFMPTLLIIIAGLLIWFANLGISRQWLS